MTEVNHAQQNAIAGVESILEMVAALECDYYRLKELRDERDDYEPGAETAPTWAEENPDDAEELAALEKEAGDCTDRDDAETRISEDPLSVEVRSGWHTPGEDGEDEEFCILLSTGGPALRIRGELSDGEPSRCWVEYQDWGTPWTQHFVGPDAAEKLLTYCRQFLFAS